MMKTRQHINPSRAKGVERFVEQENDCNMSKPASPLARFLTTATMVYEVRRLYTHLS